MFLSGRQLRAYRVKRIAKSLEPVASVLIVSLIAYVTFLILM